MWGPHQQLMLKCFKCLRLHYLAQFYLLSFRGEDAGRVAQGTLKKRFLKFVVLLGWGLDYRNGLLLKVHLKLDDGTAVNLTLLSW